MVSKKTHVLTFFKHSLLLVIGSAFCASAVKGILIPQGFLSGGFTGVALIIFYKYPLFPISILYLLINIPVFIMGWVYISFRFIMYTAWGMIIYSLMLYFIKIDFGITDKMLGAVVAGGLNGVGVAIMLRSNGSAGGSEIISIILNKLFSLSIGTSIMCFNIMVLAVSLLLYPLENVLYTLVYIMLNAYFVDLVINGLSKRQAALIVSDKWNEIVNEVACINNIGVTLIKGMGGYKKDEKNILYSILTRNQVPLLKSLVISIDPNAFVSIMSASDVIGAKVGNQPHWNQ